MTTFFIDTFDFTVTSGTAGDFSVTSTDTPNGGGVNSITGKFAGQTISALSSYNNPTNEVFQGTPYPSYHYSSAITQALFYEGPPLNGLSFTLSNGVDARIYLTQPVNGSPLAYQESNGVSGPLTLTETEYVTDLTCFLRGVLIRTPSGEAPVEALQEGDLVLTASGVARPVKWVGRTVRKSRSAAKLQDVLPVRVCAHAFGEGTPSRDLIISPGHALCLEGVLINACDLINGATVVQEEAEVVHYYHVELDSHDILIADGMPCESYLDDGNRSSFDNGADHITLHGRIDRKSAATCLPLVKEGPLLQIARDLLLLRALEMGWRLVEDAGLSLSVDGGALPPVVSVGNRHWFIVPEGSRDIRLLSNATQLNRLKPFILDDRRLGVAVAEVRIDGQVLPLDSERFGAGFYPAEHRDGSSWRWMSGEASLKLDQGLMVEVQVHAIAPTLVFRKEAVGKQTSTLVAAGWTEAN